MVAFYIEYCLDLLIISRSWLTGSIPDDLVERNRNSIVEGGNYL
jgi:hypothetical protein